MIVAAIICHVCKQSCFYGSMLITYSIAAICDRRYLVSLEKRSCIPHAVAILKVATKSSVIFVRDSLPLLGEETTQFIAACNKIMSKQNSTFAYSTTYLLENSRS